jgi:hypothetical protein
MTLALRLSAGNPCHYGPLAEVVLALSTFFLRLRIVRNMAATFVGIVDL